MPTPFFLRFQPLFYIPAVYMTDIYERYIEAIYPLDIKLGIGLLRNLAGRKLSECSFRHEFGST